MRLIQTITSTLLVTAVYALSISRRAANQVFTLSQSDASNVYDGVGVGVDSYKMYMGDGSTAAGWPAMSDWVSFQQMFDANAELMKVGCTRLGLDPGSDTTDEEIGDIYHALQSVATTSGVDHRFILAIMMQESLGCVRVYTTTNANANPGLMQDHAGVHSCNPAARGVSGQMMFPCSIEHIQGMVEEGVSGTDSGDGLAAYLNTVVTRAGFPGVLSADGSNAQMYYQVGRFYNSGSVDYSELGHGFSSRNCYASDIANRLTGWIFAQKQCGMDS